MRPPSLHPGTRPIDKHLLRRGHLKRQPRDLQLHVLYCWLLVQRGRKVELVLVVQTPCQVIEEWLERNRIAHAGTVAAASSRLRNFREQVLPAISRGRVVGGAWPALPVESVDQIGRAHV